MRCRVTVLRSLEGVLTKRVRLAADGWRMTEFSAGAWFSVHERDVADFGELVGLLERVTRAPRCAVVRGRPLPGIDPRRCRRLCDRAKHGEGVTFESAARRWLAVDVDSLPEPPGCTFAAEPEDGVEHALGTLPEPFHDASCWWQATGGAGIKPGIRCRLWFWLSRPVDDAEAKGWLARSPVDRSLYGPVSLHYVAAPILDGGARDSVARRQGVRVGLDDTVDVPAELPRVEPLAAASVELDGEELGESDLAALSGAIMRSRAARAIWAGERAFPDRSSGHFALAAALARGGCTDPDTIHRVLVAYDHRRGHDEGKILRPDYAKRTIGAALAAEGCA